MRNSFHSLLDARLELGKTQQELAEMLGISRNYVSMIELGNKPFSDRLRRKLEIVVGRSQEAAVAREPGCVYPMARTVAPEPPETMERENAFLRGEVAHLNAEIINLKLRLNEALARANEKRPE